MAIIVLDERPALPVADGTFAEPAPEWKVLEDHRRQVEHAITCVARLELEGHPYVQWVGAGTLVAPYLALIAGHAAALFTTGRGDKAVSLNEGIEAYLTAGPSTGSTVEFRLPVTAVRFVHPYFDVALLELGAGDVSNDDEDWELGIPIGLTVAEAAPTPTAGRDVAVIGFAALDQRQPPDAIEKVFGSTILPGLYVQPGRIQSIGESATYRPAIRHDCSTLGGSAGAPLIDLETGQVLGIHYGGQFRVVNEATPGWLLARDARVRACGVRFSGDPDWMYKWGIADLAASQERPAPALPEEPAVPEPDPEIHYFNQSELYRIRDLLNRTGLARPDRLHLLFVSMSTGFINTLPIDGAPDARLINTLNILNQTTPLASGELPLRTLLVNAVENSKEFPQSEQLREYLERLPEG